MRKYRNKPTNGFASQKEARRHAELKILEKAGEISDLACQVKYDFIVNGVKVATYKADFVYIERGEKISEDVKGYRTPVYRLKAKLMFACHGIRIRET